MKNIHLQKTDKPSKIGQSIFDKSLHFNPIFNYELEKERVIPQNLFITNDEEIKEGDWFIRDGSIHKCFRVHKTDVEFLTSIDSVYCGSNTFWSKEFCKKIILTTDTDLIADGVQAIDDEFLEWFVHNPSCEWVDIKKIYLSNKGEWKDVLLPSEWEVDTKINYKIIIPKEEPKETLEEAAEKYSLELLEAKTIEPHEKTWIKSMFIHIAKEQAERMYSEEEVIALIHKRMIYTLGDNYQETTTLKWFEQFKKKTQ